MIKGLIILSLLAFIACTPARIGLDAQQWNEKQELSVKGRQGLLINQKLSFGEFKTVSVKRSWTRGGSTFAGWAWGRPGYNDYSVIIGTEYSSRKQSLRFELTDDKQNESSVFCVTKAYSQDFVVGKPNSALNVVKDIFRIEDASESMFWVKLYLKNDEQPWEMAIDNEAAQMESKTYTGVVAQSKDKYYTIHPVYQLAGKNNKMYTMPMGSMGYEIRNKNGKPLAAVSLIDNGRVYLNPMDAEEKFLIANVCTALLLQEQI